MKNSLNRTSRTAGNESENENESEDMGSNELHELFLEELSDIYDAEKQLTKALPKVAKAAQSEELRSAIEQHLEETENHVSRLEQVFERLDEKPQRKTCQAMQGLVAEASELMKEKKGSSALDAALIAGCQKVEHYEIATYGTLCAWAKNMGHSEELSLLEETLEEEKAADTKLTEIAESEVNTRGQ